MCIRDRVLLYISTFRTISFWLTRLLDRSTNSTVQYSTVPQCRLTFTVLFVYLGGMRFLHLRVTRSVFLKSHVLGKVESSSNAQWLSLCSPRKQPVHPCDATPPYALQTPTARPASCGGCWIIFITFFLHMFFFFCLFEDTMGCDPFLLLVHKT